MKLEEKLIIIQSLYSELSSTTIQIKELNKKFSYADYSYSESDRFNIKHNTLSLKFRFDVITGSDTCKETVEIHDSSIVEELIKTSVQLLKERKSSIEQELNDLLI